MKLLKKQSVVLLSLLLSTLILASNAYALKCKGNACDDIFFSFQDGCYLVQNLGSKRVNVRMGPHRLIVQRGETKRLIGLDGKTCVSSYIGSTEANYENNKKVINQINSTEKKLKQQTGHSQRVDNLDERISALEKEILHLKKLLYKESKHSSGLNICIREISKKLKAIPELNYATHDELRTVISSLKAINCNIGFKGRPSTGLLPPPNVGGEIKEKKNLPIPQSRTRN